VSGAVPKKGCFYEVAQFAVFEVEQPEVFVYHNCVTSTPDSTENLFHATEMSSISGTTESEKQGI
jgi:hypothetical protein